MRFGLHLAIENQVRRHLTGVFGGGADLFGQGVAGTAEIRERQQGHARFDVETAGASGGCNGDFGEILGRGFYVYGRVGEK